MPHVMEPVVGFATCLYSVQVLSSEQVVRAKEGKLTRDHAKVQTEACSRMARHGRWRWGARLRCLRLMFARPSPDIFSLSGAPATPRSPANIEHDVDLTIAHDRGLGGCVLYGQCVIESRPLVGSMSERTGRSSGSQRLVSEAGPRMERLIVHLSCGGFQA